MLELSIIGIFGGFLALLALGYNLKSAPLANALLMTVILPMTLACVLFYLYASGWIRTFPYFYRLPAPLYLLIFPAAYLYVRTFILDRYRLERMDFIHALPAALHFFQMIPYYLLPAEQKRQIVLEVLANTERIVQFREGGFPPYVQFGVIALQGLIYCVSTYRLILSTEMPPGSRIARVGRRWLLTFTTFLMLIVVAISISFFAPLPWSDSQVDWWMISVMVAIILTTTYLFLRPDILYGLPQVDQAFHRRVEPGSGPITPGKHAGIPVIQPRAKNDGAAHRNNGVGHPGQRPSDPLPVVPKAKVPEGDFDYLRVYIPVVESHFAQQRPYRKKGYSIADLAEETDIPVHHLSALFNKVYGIRFNDYINASRLQYLEDHIHTQSFRQFTQEGLAWEAGFSSRISFFNALRKLRGISPSQFMESLQQKQENANL